MHLQTHCHVTLVSESHSDSLACHMPPTSVRDTDLCSVSTCSCSHSTALTLNVMTYFINKVFPFYFFNIMCLLQALCVCRKVCQLLPALESSVCTFFFEATLWNSNENKALLFDIWMEVCPQALIKPLFFPSSKYASFHCLQQ